MHNFFGMPISSQPFVGLNPFGQFPQQPAIGLDPGFNPFGQLPQQPAIGLDPSVAQRIYAMNFGSAMPMGSFPQAVTPFPTGTPLQQTASSTSLQAALLQQLSFINAQRYALMAQSLMQNPVQPLQMGPSSFQPIPFLPTSSPLSILNPSTLALLNQGSSPTVTPPVGTATAPVADPSFGIHSTPHESQQSTSPTLTHPFQPIPILPLSPLPIMDPSTLALLNPGSFRAVTPPVGTATTPVDDPSFDLRSTLHESQQSTSPALNTGPDGFKKPASPARFLNITPLSTSLPIPQTAAPTAPSLTSMETLPRVIIHFPSQYKKFFLESEKRPPSPSPALPIPQTAAPTGPSITSKEKSPTVTIHTPSQSEKSSLESEKRPPSPSPALPIPQTAATGPSVTSEEKSLKHPVYLSSQSKHPVYLPFQSKKPLESEKRPPSPSPALPIPQTAAPTGPSITSKEKSPTVTIHTPSQSKKSSLEEEEYESEIVVGSVISTQQSIRPPPKVKKISKTGPKRNQSTTEKTQKTFSCIFCLKTYQSHSALRRHMKKKHV